ncbi:hypothetical protein [Nocardia sp. XZ_19_369]|uniref:hypothetical protein n=1 Tax=Nocardia sp. XZ_19_369 TaxID=2769487 RepID=UPI00188EE4F6|nr:hypothetical protein [Nocardia sp. XZ_19_369]
MNITPDRHRSLDWLTDPLTEIAYLRRALTLIGTDCPVFTGTYTCTDPIWGRSPYARYAADQWCEHCIARTALTGTGFPLRGTSGVEEINNNDIIDVTHPTAALLPSPDSPSPPTPEHDVERSPASLETPMTEPATVYIAEAIWFGEDPVGGRNRLAVCSSLDVALHALRTHPIYGDPSLRATETTSALGTLPHTRTWAVHRPDAEPDDDGVLWITAEAITSTKIAAEEQT